ncbi:MAG: translation initiation factor IF-2, partial [Planctomycetota bacterium]
QEPAPQKPDIKLPADAIRASKAGSKPLSEHLRKHEAKRKATTKKTPSRQPSKQDKAAEPSTSASTAKERGRRSVRAPAKAADDATGAATLGGREQRQLKRKRTATAKRRRGGGEDDSSRTSRPLSRRLRRTGTVSTAAPRKSNVVIDLPCTVRSFSEALGLPVQQVLGKLLELGVMSTITASLDRDSADLLAEGLGAEVEFHEQVALEDKLISIAEREDAPETLVPRPPVVTFLGHVDHGKTSLLDRIIGIDVVSGEKGGITQHIRAYRIERDGHPIAFVDTPGHEAFTAMRARGANCTDIAVLVVAADDGVMPQTEEAISHARAAGVPIVVALNKIDLPGVNVDRALQELATNELLPSEWGGDIEVIRTSATTGEGIDELLETLLTVAELNEYKANPDRLASGICLEAEVQPGRGVVVKVLVDRGTLHVGDVLVCGPAHGRVKAMYDTLKPRKKHQHAGPSMPVNLTGLDVAPGAGDRFHVLEKVSEARQIAASRAATIRENELSGGPDQVTLENLYDRLGEQDAVRTLNLILRADVRGSIEAIRKELTKLEHPEVQIKMLQAAVGGITEADVELANASHGVILGFNVVQDEGARSLAEKYGVQIRRYDIIYQVTEDLKAALEGMLKPEKREVELGRALVQRTYHIGRVGTVAGCRVLAGTVARDSRIRVIRESRVVGDYPLDSLRREKDDTREVREGFECGMKLSGFNDLKEGDILEAYRIDEVPRTF